MAPTEMILKALDMVDYYCQVGCGKPEEEGNTGACCRKCAERVLKKHDAEVRREALKRYKAEQRKTAKPVHTVGRHRGHCPTCNAVQPVQHYRTGGVYYCEFCGQAIDWTEEDEE